MSPRITDASGLPLTPVRGERRTYDVMQVCEKGHIITTYALSNPDSQQRRCKDCGSETIMACKECGHQIRGARLTGVATMLEPSAPAHCIECGSRFPWTPEADTDPSHEGSADMPDMSTTDVFVIHGHDDGLKHETARCLSDLGLNPIILHEKPSLGRTIIEKFEANSTVGFAVVLLTPDDIGYSKDDPPAKAKPRARQNVILELGYFAGKLSRSRVFALRREDVEIPSYFSGVVYTPYDKAGQWKLTLVQELQAVGYDVTADDLIK